MPVDLLTQGERDEIRAALRDVTTGTFCKTPVVFKKKSTDYDRWGNGNEVSYTETVALCFVEYPMLEVNDGLASTSGMSEPFDIKLMINVEEAQTSNIFALPNIVLVSVGDLFVCNDESYKIEDWNTSGNFEQRSILLIISGIKIAK